VTNFSLSRYKDEHLEIAEHSSEGDNNQRRKSRKRNTETDCLRTDIANPDDLGEDAQSEIWSSSFANTQGVLTNDEAQTLVLYNADSGQFPCSYGAPDLYTQLLLGQEDHACPGLFNYSPWEPCHPGTFLMEGLQEEAGNGRTEEVSSGRINPGAGACDAYSTVVMGHPLHSQRTPSMPERKLNNATPDDAMDLGHLAPYNYFAKDAWDGLMDDNGISDFANILAGGKEASESFGYGFGDRLVAR